MLLPAIAMTYAQSPDKLFITVGARTLTATLADTPAAESLKERLADGAISVTANDYGGFEKVGSLPWSLPVADSQLTARSGDIMLYLGRNIVFFYGSNSWAYTRLARFDTTDADELKSFLAGSNLRIKLSLSPQSGIKSAAAGADTDEVFDLTGRCIAPEGKPKGVYIVNGKKQIIK